MKERELKSKQFNGKIQPSLYEALVKIAYVRREKVNSLLGRFIKDYVDSHKEDLDKWYDVFGSEEEKATYYGKDYEGYDSWYDD